MTPGVPAALAAQLPGAPRAMLDELARRYAEPQRRYHALSHLAYLADRFVEVDGAGLWRRPREVSCALLFHDAVYDPRAHDNEERSAELARTALANLGADLAIDLAINLDLDIDRVVALVLLTKRHGALTVEDVRGDDDAALFLDCDIAVLGGSDEEFAAYQAGVRDEYVPVVGAEAYAAGRAHFLQTFLERERIFLSPYFFERREARAREHLRRALAAA